MSSPPVHQQEYHAKNKEYKKRTTQEHINAHTQKKISERKRVRRIAKKERKEKGGNDERIEDEGKEGRRKTLQLNSNSCNISLVFISVNLRSSCLASCCLAIS
jgi:hypothetical protein